MKIYKNVWFEKFVSKQKIANAALKKAIEDAEKGTIDADLGGNVIKQRIARPKQGKSCGYRTIILFKKGEKAFFVYGFAKSDLDNIDESDVKDFKALSKELFKLSDEEIEKAVKDKILTEVK